MPWYLNLPMLLAQVGADPRTLGDSLTVLEKLVIAVGLIGGSFALGHLAGRMLKMPDYGFKLGLIFFTLFSAIAVCALGWPPKKGIDLSGGVALVYEIDHEQQKAERLRQLVTDAGSRLRQEDGTAKINNGKLEISLPAKKDRAPIDVMLERLQDSLDITLSKLEERTEGDRVVLVYSVDPGKDRKVEMDKLVAAITRRINPSGVKEVAVRPYGADIEVIIPEIEKGEVELIKKKISTSGLLEFRILANETDHKDEIALARKSDAQEVYRGGRAVARWVKVGEKFGDLRMAIYRDTPHGTEVLVMLDRLNVTGGYLSRATSSVDQSGTPCVDFVFDSAGARRFGELTGQNAPDTATGFKRQLGIVLDHTLLSAPNINDTITSHGQISGSFTKAEVDFLVGVLNAGSLPAALRPKPVYEQAISAQLGDDTIKSGSQAMIFSTIAVLVFMFVYYRFAGAVANLAVLMNLVMAVALMILIQAAFTLPGLAGLVLTIGMAVDANVLIYERMREESARGASLRMAIRNGFSRAMSTIIDSNLTTLISAVVLYMIGTDQIKGFAVTLILGLLVSMYTAIFVARVIFDIAEKKRWITRLRMMRMIGETHINFVRWRMPAIIFSLVVIAIGMLAVNRRGTDLLDIDFTGGSSVQIKLDPTKPHDIAMVRAKVADLPDVAVSGVGAERGETTEFKIDTSEKPIEKVEEHLKQVFGDALVKYSMNYDVVQVEPAKSDDPAARPATTPATTQPDTKPPTEKPEAPLQSAPAKQPPPASGARRQSDFPQLAMAGPTDAAVALVLAQADAKPDPKADKPGQTAADSPPTADEKRAAEAADKPATPASPNADEKSQDAAPSEATDAPAKTQPIQTIVQLKFDPPISHDPLREKIIEHLKAVNAPAVRVVLMNPQHEPGSSRPENDWMLQIDLPRDQAEGVVKRMQAELNQTPFFPSSNEVGGRVADNTKLMALYAMIASLVMIVIYVWVRFQNVAFGLAAVLALIHDVMVTVGFLALSYYMAPYMGFLLVDQFKISLAVLAALLTIVGYSINDTIVIFDRIREVRGKSPDLTEDMINLSLNQTLGRTILTSGTVLIATIILYIFGGQGIHPFAYAMLVGLISGTYSTVYIAAPVLLWMRKSAAKMPAREPADARSPAVR